MQTLQTKKSVVKVHTYATVPFYLAIAPEKIFAYTQIVQERAACNGKEKSVWNIS